MKVIRVLYEINCQEIIRNDKNSVGNKTWSQFAMKLFKLYTVLVLRLQFFLRSRGRALRAASSG